MNRGKAVLISGGAQVSHHPALQAQKCPLSSLTFSKGIGRCVARTFLNKGHRVYSKHGNRDIVLMSSDSNCFQVFDIQKDELEYCVNTHLQRFHPNIGYSVVNLRDISAIRTSVDAAAKFFGGKIDLLVNNAGIAHPYWKVSFDSI